MRKALFLPLIFLFIAIQSSIGQRISGGINLADIPFQIYGGAFRFESSKSFYVEGYGSFRPLAKRAALLFGSYKREGSVFDVSLGYKHDFRAKRGRSTLSLGPYIQQKRFIGKEQCGGISVFGCGQLLTERIHVNIIGLRIGMSKVLDNGLFINAYAGLGISNHQSEGEISRALDRELSIQHEDVYGHARLIVGWQFDLQRKGGD